MYPQRGADFHGGASFGGGAAVLFCAEAQPLELHHRGGHDVPLRLSHCPGFRAYDWLLAAAALVLHVTRFGVLIPGQRN